MAPFKDIQSPTPLCRYAKVHRYNSIPNGEASFLFSEAETYKREILQCSHCGHFLSVHDMDTGNLYNGEYVRATYKDGNGLRSSFERIAALPPDKSDNYGRVQRIMAFAADYFKAEGIKGSSTLIDIGSGLGVFPFRMKEAGWECTALDPDLLTIEHITGIADIRGIHGDFMALQPDRSYHVVTFNKVLEHVEKPVDMLRKSLQWLLPGGFVYIELPDGEMACREGFGREEFFIEHHHIFSAASAVLMAYHSGFTVKIMERLQEPSSKYTLRLFLTPAGESSAYDLSLSPKEPTRSEPYLGDKTQYEMQKESFKGVKSMLRKDFGKAELAIIDVGCASGAFLYHAARELNISYGAGLDVSEDHIAEAIRNVPRMDFFRSSIFSPDNSLLGQFDACVCMGVLNMVDNCELPLRNMMQLLRDNGHLYIWDIFNDDPVDLIVSHRIVDSKGISDWKAGYNTHSKQTIEEILRLIAPTGRLTWTDFSMPFPMKKTNNCMRAWTIKTEHNQHQSIVGSCILLNFKILHVVKD